MTHTKNKPFPSSSASNVCGSAVATAAALATEPAPSSDVLEPWLLEMFALRPRVATRRAVFGV